MFRLSLFCLFLLFIGNGVLALPDQSDSLDTKKYTFEQANTTKAIFEALKKDSVFKHGEYTLYYKGEKQVTGYYYKNKKQGIWTCYYSSGKKKLQGSYINDQKHGVWEFYYPNGELGAKTNYVLGISTGTWRGYYSDGTPSCIYNYENGKLSGEFVLYHPNGLIAQNTKIKYVGKDLYVNTNKYYDSGRIYEESYFFNELPDGVYKRYHRIGPIWEDMLYDKGKLIAINSMKSRDATNLVIGNFNNGTGEAHFYHADGTLHSEVNYRNGLLNGKARYYYKTDLGIEGFFLDGKRFSTWKYYTEFGKLRTERNFYDGRGRTYERTYTGSGFEGQEGEMQNGMRDGLWKTYNFHGDVVEETHYLKDFRHGSHLKYDNGLVRVEGGYYYGEPVGEWNYFNNNKKVTFQQHYVKDVRFDSSLIEPYEIPWPREQNNDYNYETDIRAASFPGGEGEEKNFILDNIDYPSQAEALEISGEIIVHFKVSEMGELFDIKILRGIGYGCDAEVIRVFQSMPYWTPMLTNGIPTETSVLRIIEI